MLIFWLRDEFFDPTGSTRWHDIFKKRKFFSPQLWLLSFFIPRAKLHFLSLVESEPKQPPSLYLSLHLDDLRPPLASVHLAVWSRHKVCVKPVVAGRCQFMRVGSVDRTSFTALRFIPCPGTAFSHSFSLFLEGLLCSLQQLRPSPVKVDAPPLPHLFLMAIRVCIQALGGGGGGLGLYHSGKQRWSVLCHLKGWVEHTGCKGEGQVNLNSTEDRLTCEEMSKG